MSMFYSALDIKSSSYLVELDICLIVGAYPATAAIKSDALLSAAFSPPTTDVSSI
jgi:hypothetical protein